jgi:hypothetical protein
MLISRETQLLPPRYRNIFARLVIREVSDITEVVDLVRSEQAQHPHASIFVTLDDLDQALYTSMHATESDELEIDTGDLDFVNDQDADELAQQRQFAHTTAQLANPELRQSWGQLRGSRETDAAGIAALAAMNDSPTGVLDEVTILMHVPTDDRTTAIAALPNGYFSDDWNTFQHHAVARHLAKRYQYQAFGIGASWAGYLRDTPLLADDAAQLVSDLAELYGCADAPGWQLLSEVLTRQCTLFLGYTDNFAD